MKFSDLICGQRYCKEKLNSVLQSVSFSSMLNICRFLILDLLRIRLFGCRGGNALLVLLNED